MKASNHLLASESDILKELRSTGRDISQLTLLRWRRFGLLPPLSQRGLGPGKRTATYWPQCDLFQQVSFVYDSLLTYSERHVILRILWLSGFEVPLDRLRRAWAHCNKRDQSWAVQPASVRDGVFGPGRQPVNGKNIESSDPDYRGARALLNLVLSVSGSLSPRHPDLSTNKFNQIINMALLKLAPTQEKASSVSKIFRERVVLLAEMLALAIRQSNLLQVATEAELTIARQHLNILGRFVQFCIYPDRNATCATAQAPFWSPELAEEVGAPLFLYILALNRMGYGEQLNATGVAMTSLCSYWESQITVGAAGSSADHLEIAKFRHHCASTWQAFALV